MQLPHMTPHFNFIRKPPADFGWDWGPNFTPAGIYGTPLLVAHDHAYLAGKCSKPVYLFMQLFRVLGPGLVLLCVICASSNKACGVVMLFAVNCRGLSVSAYAWSM